MYNMNGLGDSSREIFFDVQENDVYFDKIWQIDTEFLYLLPGGLKLLDHVISRIHLINFYN